MISSIFFTSKVAHANVPYKTFTEGHKRNYILTQDSYMPIESIEALGDLAFSNPSDIYIDKEDTIYIADTDNNRVVLINPDQSLKTIIGEETLNKPTGVFVDDKGFIYIADGGNQAVYKFNQDGQVVQEFRKPKSPIFGKGSPYKPLKVTVDKRGNIYIVGEGTTNGLIQLSPHGDFLGYFGTNESRFGLRIMFQRLFFTEAQLKKLSRNVPPSVTNVAIDDKGLVYTVTQGAKGKSVKKLNISGNNMLADDMNFDPAFTDIYIGAVGNIYVISHLGFIYEFDSEGNLIFRLGGLDDGKLREGLFVDPSGIAVNSEGHIFVLDKERANIQQFAPTEFTDEVHQALELYQEGYYVQSQEPWNKVLQMNNLFDLAHKGLGESFYKQQIYENALDEFEIANYKKGYSNAFWELRNKWLQNNLATLFLFALGLFILWKVMKILQRKWKVFNWFIQVWGKVKEIKVVKELLFIFHFIKQPIDGYYGIKRENQASILSATILYVIYFIEHLVSLYYSGFIFTFIELSDIMLSKEVVMIYAPFALWVVANYLVSTINDGEGSFKDIYIATIYALFPFILF